jgi:uncharacterized protein (TIGR03435 family)
VQKTAIGLFATLILLAGAPHFAIRPRAQSAPNIPAQTAKPAFEVVSIKPNKSCTAGSYYLRSQPGGLFRETTRVRFLIASAYLKGFTPTTIRLVLGGPSWIDSECFDIEAGRGQGPPGNEQEHLMIQSLLEDRFHLVLRHETRQMAVYSLSKPGQTGRQLVPHSSDAKCSSEPLKQPRPGEPMPAYCGGYFMNPQPGDLRATGNGITMDEFGRFISQSLDRIVVDQTGLTGLFDVALEFAPDVGPGALPAGATPDPSAPPSIFTALREQLGLKLELKEAPVDVLVIDHIEEPSPN